MEFRFMNEGSAIFPGRWLIAPLLMLAALLAGFGQDTPSDKLTADTIRPLAQSDAGAAGIEVEDFTRDNGWVDPQAPNRYIVRYKYNWKLVKPFPEVVLGIAKDEKDDVDQQKKTLFGGLTSAGAILSASQWVAEEGDSFPARRDSVLKACATCRQWLAQGDDTEQSVRLALFYLAWQSMESAGWSDSNEVGHTIPRTYWHAFIKSENGWIAVQEQD